MPMINTVKKLKECIMKSVEKCVCQALNIGLIEKFKITDVDDSETIEIRYKKDKKKLLVIIKEVEI